MAIRWKKGLALALLVWVTGVQGAPTLKSQRHGATAEANSKAGAAFLAENKDREGVVSLESGLQYRILKAGDGARPTLDDTVVVQYRGSLIDGTEFYNSRTRGQPATIPVRKAIAGWREGLQLMPAGSRWELFIPPQLAYGERGAGGLIRPNSTLIFEAELVSIKQPEVKASPANAGLKDIKVSFKLDPRLTRSLYMGDRWVSPSMFTPARQGKTTTVEATADGLNGKGERIRIKPEWIAADPGMVEVTGGEDDGVRITVKRPGESTLKVVAQGVTKELAIKAVDQGDAIAVEIAQ
jgi:FKBP-type peptidyl-prolyl cis-trans isomerase